MYVEDWRYPNEQGGEKKKSRAAVVNSSPTGATASL